MQKRFVRLVVSFLFAATIHLAAAAPTVEEHASTAIHSDGVAVVHLWAPWCSNCLAELKSGDWPNLIKANPGVRFVFVSVWDNGDDGRAMLAKFHVADLPNVTILADPGPRGDGRRKRFLDLPLTWIPTTWLFKSGELRYALSYGELRFPALQQFIEDANSEWSHKGEPTPAAR